MADGTVGPNIFFISLKKLKLNLPGFLFWEQNELSKDLENRFHQIVQDRDGISFSKILRMM